MGVPHPFLDHGGPIPFAHRGGAGDWPENTMPAFEGAWRLGYRYVETDVHVTADGVVVAFHDDRLDRVTDRAGSIGALPWSEVARARVGGTEAVPRLDDLLGSLPDLRVNIDPKHDAVVEPLVDALRRCDALGRVCIGSFSDTRLLRLRAHLGPSVCMSLGPRGVAALRLGRGRLPAGKLAAAAAQVPVRARGVTIVDRRFVDAAHRRDLHVHVWTIDEPGEMHRLLDLGVDGIMTDRPAVLRDVLEQRGEWVA